MARKQKKDFDQIIQDKINGFQFTDEDCYTDEDLTPYIGEKVAGSFSRETQKIIEEDIRSDRFGLKEMLKEVYGERAVFREGQEEAVLSVLNGKRTLVIQRTGWGKSLVYFLSVKKLRQMGKGPAIIISPLLALMNNQVASTKKFNINVRTLNSANLEEWDKVYEDLDSDQIDALIISPERLGNENFMGLLGRIMNRISLFVVDEAHCISDWGHDFRPDFRRIVKVIRRLPADTPVLATTATANDRVVRDIKYQLGSNLEIMRGTMERLSINIDVLKFVSDDSKKEWLAENLPAMEGVGIIYCLTIKACEEVTAFLMSNDINAVIYHSQISPDQKVETENRFQNNEIKVLVATIAFGMGVDKPDIAFVIHYQQPGNAIAYYQQIGRAGRDIGKVPKAYAILMVGEDDNNINAYFIQNAFPTENEMNDVVSFITDNPGISAAEIVSVLDEEQVWVDKVLKYLLVNGDIDRKKGRYYKSAREWECDMKRARIVSWFRWRELGRFQEYVSTKQCYMKFLREELDDTGAERCGRCSNCLGHHFSFRKKETDE